VRPGHRPRLRAHRRSMSTNTSMNASHPARRRPRPAQELRLFRLPRRRKLRPPMRSGHRPRRRTMPRRPPSQTPRPLRSRTRRRADIRQAPDLMQVDLDPAARRWPTMRLRPSPHRCRPHRRRRRR
jgi:hypothetical protein